MPNKWVLKQKKETFGEGTEQQKVWYPRGKWESLHWIAARLMTFELSSIDLFESIRKCRPVSGLERSLKKKNSIDASLVPSIVKAFKPSTGGTVPCQLRASSRGKGRTLNLVGHAMTGNHVKKIICPKFARQKWTNYGSAALVQKVQFTCSVADWLSTTNCSLNKNLEKHRKTHIELEILFL